MFDYNICGKKRTNNLEFIKMPRGHAYIFVTHLSNAINFQQYNS